GATEPFKYRWRLYDIFEGNLFTENALCRIEECTPRPRTFIVDDGFTFVDSNNDSFIFGNNAQEVDAEYFQDVCDIHHVAAFHHFGAQTIKDQTRFRLACRFYQTNDTISITHRGHFWIGNDDDLVCADDSIPESLLDAGGRIDQHKIELLAKLLAELLHLDTIHSVFIACLGGR